MAIIQKEYVNSIVIVFNADNEFKAASAETTFAIYSDGTLISERSGGLKDVNSLDVSKMLNSDVLLNQILTLTAKLETAKSLQPVEVAPGYKFVSASALRKILRKHNSLNKIMKVMAQMPEDSDMVTTWEYTTNWPIETIKSLDVLQIFKAAGISDETIALITYDLEQN
jgi:hypothetical protein